MPLFDMISGDETPNKIAGPNSHPPRCLRTDAVGRLSRFAPIALSQVAVGQLDRWAD
jgi:hypothetical protein